MLLITNIYVPFTKTILMDIHRLPPADLITSIESLNRRLSMSTTHTHFRRVLAVTALSLGLSISIAAPASTAVAGGDQMTQAWARRRQEMLKAHLAKLAERLEIRA